MNGLFSQYPTIIGLMPENFTSHQFILALAQRNQADYVAALAGHTAGGAPFRAVHNQLSHALHNYPSLVEHTGTAPSDDIFLNPGECATWRRI